MLAKKSEVEEDWLSEAMLSLSIVVLLFLFSMIRWFWCCGWRWTIVLHSEHKGFSHVLQNNSGFSVPQIFPPFKLQHRLMLHSLYCQHCSLSWSNLFPCINRCSALHNPVDAAISSLSSPTVVLPGTQKLSVLVLSRTNKLEHEMGDLYKNAL